MRDEEGGVIPQNLMISRGGQIGKEANSMNHGIFEDEWNLLMGASPHAPFRFGLAASARKCSTEQNSYEAGRNYFQENDTGGFHSPTHCTGTLAFNLCKRFYRGFEVHKILDE